MAWVNGTPENYTLAGLGESQPPAVAPEPDVSKQNDLVYLLSVISSLALIFRR